jgi:SEC-C motif-containing protein
MERGTQKGKDHGGAEHCLLADPVPGRLCARMELTTCPCRLTAIAQLPYAECCQPFIEGRAKAPTAEALMRSRYSAFAVTAIDYLVETVAPEARADMDRASLEAWSRESKWHGLDIVDTVDGKPGDLSGIVEFVAHFSRGGARETHHERSTFRFAPDSAQWYFVDGAKPKGKTVVKGKQPERNDPCPCGSGKKYKKCCGAAA